MKKKKHSKLYTTNKIKDNKCCLHINPEDRTFRNELHFNVQLHTKATIVESKKYKKEKHKKDYIRDYSE